MLWHQRVNPRGLFDVRFMRDVSVITAAGVGGGSLVYANVQLRAPADVFERALAGGDHDRQELDPWYDRTEEALQPVQTPAEPALPKVQSVRRAGQTGGSRGGAAADRGPFRRGPPAPVQRRAPGGLPEPRPLRPRLPGARQEHRRHHLHRQAPKRTAPRCARCTSSSASSRPPPPAGAGASASGTSTAAAKARVEAPTVVLAAGTLGSSRLLLTNQRRLPRLSPALGSRFSGNGDALGIAFDPADPEIKGAQTRLRPGDDQRARLHRRSQADRRRRRPAGRTSASCSTSPAPST